MRIILLFILSFFISNGAFSQYTPLPKVTLQTLYGKTVDQSFLNNGKDASILVLTTKKCPPCDRQIDSLLAHKSELEEDFGSRIIIVVQNFFKDDNYSFEELKTYAKSKSWGTEVYIDKEGVFRKWLNSQELPIVIYSFNEQIYGWTKGHQGFKFPKVLLDNYSGSRRWFDKKWNMTSKGKHTFYRDIDFNMQPDSSYKVVDYYKDGSKQMTGAYINIGKELKEGEFIWYYKNGKTKEIKNYSRGSYHGYNMRQTEEGIPTRDCYYKNGKLDSLYKYYHDDGKIWSLMEYKNGKQWNVKGTWSKTGDSLDYGTFKNGNGVYNSYNREGELQTVTNFKNGSWEGLRTRYNKEGKVLTKKFYKEGSRDWEKEYKTIGTKVSNALIKQDVAELGLYGVNDNNIKEVVENELSKEEAASMLEDIPAVVSMFNSTMKKSIKKAKIDVIQHHGEMINKVGFSYAKKVENEGLLSSQKELELGLKGANGTIKFKVIIKKIDYTFFIVETIEIKPE